MRLITIILAFVMLASTHAMAKDTCGELLESFEEFYKSIAIIEAESVGDNSAPRAQLRTLRIIRLQNKQHIILRFATAHKCKLPASPGSYGDYYLAALKCRNKSVETGKYDSPECNRSNWKPIKK